MIRGEWLSLVLDTGLKGHWIMWDAQLKAVKREESFQEPQSSQRGISAVAPQLRATILGNEKPFIRPEF